MSNVRVVLKSYGIRELLKSDEMSKFVKEQADIIRDRCGAGYESDVKQMQTRVIASVYTEDTEAMQDNLENNTLLRAMQ